MGCISRKLANRLDGDRRRLQRLRAQIHEIQTQPVSVPDPTHAAYVRAQNLTSVFAEAVSPLPDLKTYYDTMTNAEEAYMPSSPPMSPLTMTYFTSWAFFDFRFGQDLETIGTILLDLSEHAGLAPADFRVLRQFQQSRMGIYEHCGTDGSRWRFRELITDDLFTCVVPAGYLGRPGELWYIRLCPPVSGHDYHVAFNTPYVLQQTSKADWTAYLERSLDKLTGQDPRSKLFHLLKFGRHVNGWNEFVFQGYCAHQSDAVFLAGLPDRPATLPHADTTGRRRCG